MPASKSKKPSSQAKKRAPVPVPVHKFEPEAEPPDADDSAAFPLEVDPKRIEEALAKLKDDVVNWANKGRYTKVRFKFRGKQLLPDIPLAAVIAAEGLTFYWGGILRALVMNIAGKTV